MTSHLVISLIVGNHLFVIAVHGVKPSLITQLNQLVMGLEISISVKKNLARTHLPEFRDNYLQFFVAQPVGAYIPQPGHRDLAPVGGAEAIWVQKSLSRLRYLDTHRLRCRLHYCSYIHLRTDGIKFVRFGINLYLMAFNLIIEGYSLPCLRTQKSAAFSIRRLTPHIFRSVSPSSSGACTWACVSPQNRQLGALVEVPSVRSRKRVCYRWVWATQKPPSNRLLLFQPKKTPVAMA